jgi:hypothetical protein
LICKWIPYCIDETEVGIQRLLAERGITVPIEHTFRYGRSMGIIMPRLVQTLYDDLFVLSDSQRSACRAYYQSSLDKISEGLPAAYLVHFQTSLDHSGTNTTNLFDIWYTKLRDLWYKHHPNIAHLSPPPIVLTDTIEQQTRKKQIIRSVVQLISSLTNVVHGDLHLSNIMRDHDGRYYLIDFGKSRIDVPSIDLDFFWTSLEFHRQKQDTRSVRYDMGYIREMSDNRK